MLKAKSAMTDADAQRAWEQADLAVSLDQCEMAVFAAIAELRGLFNDRYRLAYGWSGGKDSLALQVVMERAGIEQWMIGVVRHLEYPAHMVWLTQAANLPKGRGVTYMRDDLTLDWLAKHPERLFPKGGKDGYWWTVAGTRNAQTRYVNEEKPDVMIYGRRTLDGNVCGNAQGIAPGHGIVVYNPLRKWSHELTLAVVKHLWLPDKEGRTLPPVYTTPNGWTSGTGPWPGKHYATHDDGWAATFATDPAVVFAAANHGVPGAAEWLRHNRSR